VTAAAAATAATITDILANYSAVGAVLRTSSNLVFGARAQRDVISAERRDVRRNCSTQQSAETCPSFIPPMTM